MWKGRKGEPCLCRLGKETAMKIEPLGKSKNKQVRKGIYGGEARGGLTGSSTKCWSSEEDRNRRWVAWKQKMDETRKQPSATQAESAGCTE